MNKLLERFKKNTKFTETEWNSLNEEIQRESLQFICRKYGIKKSYVKAYKEYLNGTN